MVKLLDVPVRKYPNITQCIAAGWDVGPDPNPPAGPYPLAGQRVYIQDELNFCLNLPNPNDPYLIANYYSQGKWPSIVDAEGYVQSYCMGSYLPAGSLPMPDGAIQSAHVLIDFSQTKYPEKYYQIWGTMDCERLHINCTQSYPGAYDDGGQYDSVPYKYCGKEPYSGSDPVKHPGFTDYLEQAGDGLFCMRVCQPGQQLTDACDAKMDTEGCYATMGVTFSPGFSFEDLTNGITTVISPSIPPPLATTTATNAASSTASNNGTANGAVTGSSAVVAATGTSTQAKASGAQKIALFGLTFAVSLLHAFLLQ